MYIRVQLPYPYSYSYPYPYPYPYSYPYPYTLYLIPYTIPDGWYHPTVIFRYHGVLYTIYYPISPGQKKLPPPVLSPPLLLCRKQQNVCPFASKLKARGGGKGGGVHFGVKSCGEPCFLTGYVTY